MNIIPTLTVEIVIGCETSEKFLRFCSTVYKSGSLLICEFRSAFRPPGQSLPASSIQSQSFPCPCDREICTRRPSSRSISICAARTLGSILGGSACSRSIAGALVLVDQFLELLHGELSLNRQVGNLRNPVWHQSNVSRTRASLNPNCPVPRYCCTGFGSLSKRV